MSWSSRLAVAGLLWIASFDPAAAPTLAPAAAPTTAPSARRVLVISVDGMRPDLVLRGDTPTMHRLITQGAYTFWAQTTAVAVTIPSHVSMLTGARPQIHQIEWNHDIPLAHPIYPAVPTLFEVAHKAGYSTGMIAGKSKFDVFEKPGTLDVEWAPATEVVSDREVLEHTLNVINAGAPQVLFVHLPETDKVGHAVGWGSPEQMDAIHGADSAIGTILGTLASKRLLDETLVIISADHGGAGRKHGPDDVRSRCIPWICVGPGIRHGVDLTTVAPDRTVRTEDTFATACDFLHIAVDSALDGKPVVEAYDRTGQELLTDSVPATATPPSALQAAAVTPAARAPATRPTDTLVLRAHAVAQTQVVDGLADAAVAPAVWVHAGNPTRSTIIGTDKRAGLCVYDLLGTLLQTVSTETHPGDIGVVYGFPLDGRPTDLAVAGTRAQGSRGVKVWSIDAKTGWLSDVTAGGVLPAFQGNEPYGSCVYHSSRDGAFYYFVTNQSGQVEQYKLADESGVVDATLVRQFAVPSQARGCVCDDRTGELYLSEAAVGIWKFGAEPDAPPTGRLIAKVDENGLTADVAGLTLYEGVGDIGYLIASSQGDNTFKVYQRAGGNAFVASIVSEADQKVDAVTGTDGLAAISRPLGPDFPAGMLVAQDHETPDGRQNFKIFDWRDIAGRQLPARPETMPRAGDAVSASR